MNTILGTAASPYNDLAIPTVMGPVLLITRGVAFGLFAFFFIAEVVRLQWTTLEYAAGSRAGRPHLNQFLTRATLILFSLTFLYSWTFLKIVSLSDHIAMLLSDEQQWQDLITRLSGASASSIPLLHITIPSLVGAVAFTLLQYVQDVFIAIRFVILSLLFAAGPIVWALGVSELGLSAIKGWFKTTWKVSFWFVVFSIVKAAVVPVAANAFTQAGGVDVIVATVYATVIVIALFMVPALTDAIFSEANIGAVAGAAMTIASFATIRSVAAHGEAGHGLISGGDRVTSIRGAVEAYKEAGGAKGLFQRFLPSNGGGQSPERPRKR